VGVLTADIATTVPSAKIATRDCAPATLLLTQWSNKTKTSQVVAVVIVIDIAGKVIQVQPPGVVQESEYSFSTYACTFPILSAVTAPFWIFVLVIAPFATLSVVTASFAILEIPTAVISASVMVPS
jgi:hypothetical protein